MPGCGRVAPLGAQLGGLEAQIAELDRKLAAQHKANPINRTLAEVPGIGATAVIEAGKPGNRNATGWLPQLLGRKPRKVAAVALANKMARSVWAMPSSAEACRHAPVAI